MARPKGKPTTIYTIRHDEELVVRLKKRHGKKLHTYFKAKMTQIDKAKRIPNK